MKKSLLYTAMACATVFTTAAQAEFEASGYVGFEWREHFQEGQFDNDDVTQADRQLSLTFEPEFAWDFADGQHIVVFKPYGRYDNEDEERTHGDIRELSWLTFGDDWEIKAGISKVYWGVTESQHLVDIVNQTDFVEAPDGEEKLGQPMVKLSLVRDWGLIDAFVLPTFRERTFPGEDGRLRPGIKINTSDAQYQAEEEQDHIDYALRWSHTIEDYDIGLSYFNGTSRDPALLPEFAGPTVLPETDEFGNPTGSANILAEDNTILSLTPLYLQIQQVGLDIQATLDSWLWKLEAIHREFDSYTQNIARGNEVISQEFDFEDYTAATGGFEYTLYGIQETDWDLGLLTEYQYDSRDDSAQATGQNDAFFGGRLALNDAASSEILFGISQDLDDTETRGVLLEAETRIGETIKFNVDMFIFMSDEEDNINYQFRQDDYIQATLNYYF